MSNKEETFRDAEKIEATLKSRKVYRKPHLQELGDLRSLTLSGSPGVGDSQSPTTQRSPGSSPGDFLPPPEF